MTDYPNTLLHIDGAWTDGTGGRRLNVVSPSTGRSIGQVAVAEPADTLRAAQVAGRAFQDWRRISAYERASILHRAAGLLRDRLEEVATLLTLEQGKPFAESKMEVSVGADVIDWFAGEAQRTYGRVVPSRSSQTVQSIIREPVGPVAAFSPWNFPINQIVRKIAAALAAGCSVIAKCPNETPASPAALVQAFIDAGLPDGAINLLYGDAASISETLISHPTIRKISFTGSTSVGKVLARQAGENMKRMTMELGGHAPVIVTADADLTLAVDVLTRSKYRNAGQVCISPTRFIVHESIYDQFEARFTAAAAAIVVGNGLDPHTQMGPLANIRRVDAIEALVRDAVAHGAELRLGGNRIGNHGFFFAPTVLGRVSASSRIMNEEPFGPVAALTPFQTIDDAVAEANRLPFGLAAYAYTSSLATARMLTNEIAAGMVSINGAALALPETPNGGIKDSGFGAEGGIEGMEGYLTTKFCAVA